ncbi:membrane protein [Thermoactinomyces vulgaris]|jgi:hypothetical protein|nr:membrane protein [Thermoactinomyces vulgaris]
MERGTTLFLKIAVLIIGAPVMALGIYGLIWLATHPANPDYAHMLYPILLGIYACTIPFYIALYHAFKLLNYIDQNKAFSSISVRALKKIKTCAITISAFLVAIMPFVYLLADKDDAPGLILISLVPIFASMVIAVFAAVLQRLLQEAVEIKSENDLIV